ncbi:MAG: 4-(cytidine 5'-diphospho)-2-C-methyl-D-erythritol kinase [Rhodobacteraceae bacterium]|nr:4-(cytidine 5'-diphospho)-2-C-methyl-D-erythritol kinase [Paracoccaceae bacterium]
MTTVEAFAPAKINLTLHVTGQRADGYHLLDSLVVFSDVGDRLWLREGPEMRLEVSGPFATGVPTDARNLVWRAAELAGWRGEIRLEKNLPHGGGIGGGSSDAAAVLNALTAPEGAGLTLGADVPVCRVGGPVRMRGIGEDLAPVQDWPQMHAVLVNPGVHVPTPAVFARLTDKAQPEMTFEINGVGRGAAVDWLARQRNDLQEPAGALAPEIAEVLVMLEACDGAQLVRMSGSGSTCFAIFDGGAAARAAADALGDKQPGWWVQPCVFGGAGAG